MGYIFLILYTVVLIVAMVCIFRRKVYSPSVLFLMGYLLSIILAVIGLKTWNMVTDLNGITIIILCISMLSFCVGDILSTTAKIKKKKDSSYGDDRVIRIPKIIYFFSIVLYLATCFLVIRDLNNICSKLGCSDFGLFEKMRFYHDNSGLFTTDAVSYSALNNWCFRIANALSGYYIFVFFNNLARKDSVKNNLYIVVPIILCIIMAFIRGGRGSTMTYICAILTMYLISKLKNKKNRQSRILKRVIPIVIGIFAVFYSVVPLLGRSTELDATGYISAYLGCPIPLLNIAIEQGITQGAESPLDNSLYGLRGFASYLKLDINEKERSLPFIEIGGFNTNVYTSAFRLYDDFGIGLAAVFIMLSGYLFGLLCKLVERRNDYRYTILYILLASKIIDMCRDETFYTLVLTPMTVITCGLILMIGVILIKFRTDEHEKADI